jgi:hypothetical protein
MDPGCRNVLAAAVRLVALLFNHGVHPAPVPADLAISFAAHFRTFGIYRIVVAAAFFLLEIHDQLLSPWNQQYPL